MICFFSLFLWAKIKIDNDTRSILIFEFLLWIKNLKEKCKFSLRIKVVIDVIRYKMCYTYIYLLLLLLFNDNTYNNKIFYYFHSLNVLSSQHDKKVSLSIFIISLIELMCLLCITTSSFDCKL